MGRSFSGVRVCPFCGESELEHGESISRCGYCDRLVEEAVVKTIEQIADLPDALGSHACECGHPEMRRLPDGVFHCPACGAEVVFLKAAPSAPGPTGLDELDPFASTVSFPARLKWLIGRKRGIWGDHAIRPSRNHQWQRGRSDLPMRD